MSRRGAVVALCLVSYVVGLVSVAVWLLVREAGGANRLSCTQRQGCTLVTTNATGSATTYRFTREQLVDAVIDDSGDATSVELHFTTDGSAGGPPAVVLFANSVPEEGEAEALVAEVRTFRDDRSDRPGPLDVTYDNTAESKVAGYVFLAMAVAGAVGVPIAYQRRLRAEGIGATGSTGSTGSTRTASDQ